MTKTISAFDLATFSLSDDTATDSAPLHMRLYAQLRDAILDERLKPGVRLPSTRAFAASLHVSRNTVLSAFDQLLAEGYIESHVGDGSYISAYLPDDLQRKRNAVGAGRAAAAAPRLSVRIEQVLAGPDGGSGAVISARAFRTGMPAVDQFPAALWSRLYSRRLRQQPDGLLSYGSAIGYQPLRESIAAYLGSTRSIPCHADQIVITAASQEALMLISAVLLSPGDAAWMEDPGYQGARSALFGASAHVVPVPVDGDGLCVDDGKRLAPHARLAYVTPTVQYPLGSTMSLPRRLALLEWAARANAWIIEDDYASEYRFGGRPLATLYSLDKRQRVIYVGTFSKLLFGALRIGYIVLPEQLVDVFKRARARFHLYVSALDQAVLNDFIVEGHFARHVRRMRELYAGRRDLLTETLQQECRGVFTLPDVQAGLNIATFLTDNRSDLAITRAAAQLGVEAQALSSYAMLPQQRGGLVLGYGSVNERQIRDGVRKLAKAIATVAAARKTERA
jgi:GntR family transcriptional regulator / MocR family aminotransferase